MASAARSSTAQSPGSWSWSMITTYRQQDKRTLKRKVSAHMQKLSTLEQPHASREVTNHMSLHHSSIHKVAHCLYHALHTSNLCIFQGAEAPLCGHQAQAQLSSAQPVLESTSLLPGSSAREIRHARRTSRRRPCHRSSDCDTSSTCRQTTLVAGTILQERRRIRKQATEPLLVCLQQSWPSQAARLARL